MTEKLSAEAMQKISENYKRITENIEEARIRAGLQNGHPVKLCAATKTVSPGIIGYAASLGLCCIGENRVSELLEKYGALERLNLELHFIGGLQTNKIRSLVGKVSMIQSLDNVRAAAEIDKWCEKLGIEMDTLIEINIGEEENKGGIMPGELEDFAAQVSLYKNINIRGLMTIGPHCEKKDDYRKYFEKISRIFIDIYTKKIHNVGIPFLSMGMSDNYDLAVEYGANIVRPGSALFGPRGI